MPVETVVQRNQRQAEEKAAAQKVADEQAAKDEAAKLADERNKSAESVDSRQQASAEAVKQDRPEPKQDVNATPQSYVWLSDGSVLRVNDEDLPGGSGAQNPHGHWQRGNKVYDIVNIYPVESVLEENK